MSARLPRINIPRWTNILLALGLAREAVAEFVAELESELGALATKHDLTLGLRDLELRMIKIMVTLTALNIGANALIFTFLA